MGQRFHAGFAEVTSLVAIIVTIYASFFVYSGDETSYGRETKNGPCISVFQINLDKRTEIDASNRALSLIQDTYRRDYYNSSISHHHFVRTAPAEIQETLSEFVWSNSALKQVRSKFGATDAQDETSTISRNNGGGVRVIQDVFDEIYLMRPEFDLLDQKKVHYDGNLKLPGICTIRALTYLSGKDAMLFALTSQQNFTTRNQTSIVLDFDRELHYVSLNPSLARMNTAEEVVVGGQRVSEPRVMIKSAMHVILPGTHPLVAYFRIIVHRTMLFGARSFRRAFESQSQLKSNTSSKSNVSMMAVDNLMRSMNKIHMALPLLVIGLPIGAIFLAPVFFPLQFSPYIILIIARYILKTNPNSQLGTFWVRLLLTGAVLSVLANRSRLFASIRWKILPNIRVTKRMSQKLNASTVASFSLDVFRLVLFHIAWFGVCYYFEANIDMMNEILLAPRQQVIRLVDIL